MFEFSMIPTINRPMRVTKHTATAIDNITNHILNSDFKSAIVKMDLSDHHFPFIFINEFIWDATPTDDMEKYIYKQDFTEKAFNCFEQTLSETSWDSVKNCTQPN